MNVVANRQNCESASESETTSQPDRTYLLLVKDGSEAVEELEWCEDLALDQNTAYHCRSCPPSCADWHLKEPLLQR